MVKRLKVYIQGDLAGYLIQKENAKLQFKYKDDYCGIPLSITIPVRSKAYSHDEIFAFLENLLPEQLYRTLIAKNYKVSEKNIFSLLSVVGKECAGAISFYNEDQEYQKEETFNILEFVKKNNAIDRQTLDNLVESLENNHFSGDIHKRMSLAGAQPKIVLFAMIKPKNNAITLYDSSDKIPSNVIIKVNNKDYKSLVFNEFFCMNLASLVGLKTPKVRIEKTKSGRFFLLVSRFDRLITTKNGKMHIERLWQMDFCQKLKIPSVKKYQSDGGPSIKNIYDNFNDAENKANLIRAIIFNFLIGNNDAHGKNFSILEEGSIYKLSPLYDLVSTIIYTDLNEKMAMKIGGEYKHKKIRYRHFMKLASEIGMNEKLMDNLMKDVSSKILQAAEKLKINLEDQFLNSDVYQKVINCIKNNLNTIEKSKKLYLENLNRLDLL